MGTTINVNKGTSNRKKLKEYVDKYGADKVNEHLKKQGVTYDGEGNLNVEGARNEKALNTKGHTSISKKGVTGEVSDKEMVDTGTKELPIEYKATDETNQYKVPTYKGAIEESIKDIKEKKEGLQTESDKRIEEDKIIAEDKINKIEIYTKRNEELIKEKDEKLKAIEEENAKLIKESTDRNKKILEEKSAIEVENAKAEAEEQKLENQYAIEEAERKIEVEKLRAAWNFNKFGLGFSSGIVNTVQQIATLGAERIATLKIKAKRYETETKNKIRTIELGYTQEINKLIDTSLTNQLKIKESSVRRINETSSNLLLSNKEKETKIEEIKEKYIKEKRVNEDKLKLEQERLTDKYIQRTKELELETEKELNNKKKDLDIDLQTGTIMQLTPAEIVKKEKELGFTPGTINATISNSITSKIGQLYKNAGYGDVLIEDMDVVISNAKQYMKLGYSYEEAINKAFNKSIKSNPEVIKRKKEEEALAITKRKAVSAKNLGSSNIGIVEGEQQLRDEYFKLFNKTPPTKATIQGIAMAVNKRRKENEIKKSEKYIEKVKGGFLPNEDFKEQNKTEITEIETGISTGDEKLMRKGIKSIINGIKNFGADDDIVKQYLIKNNIVAETYGDLEDDGLYFDEDGNIKETTGINETIYKFSK